MIDAQSWLVLWKLASRNVARNRRRTALTTLAVGLGVWTSVALAAFARGISGEMADNAIYDLTGHVQVHHPDYPQDPVVSNSIPDSSAKIMQALPPGVVLGSAARVRVPAVVRSEKKATGVTLVGIDPDAEHGLSFIGDGVISGRPIEGPDDQGIVIGQKLAEHLQTALGRRVVVMSQDVNGKLAERGFRITGIFDAELEATEKAFIFCGRGTAQQLLGLGAQISEISIVGQNRDGADVIVNAVQAAVPEAAVRSWRKAAPFADALLRVQNAFLKFWFLIVVIAVSFGLINTIFMSIFERAREFGLIQSLGMRPHNVIVQVALEAFLVLLGGMVIGNCGAWLTVRALSGGVDLSRFARGMEMMGVSRVVYPTILARDIITANLFVLVLCLLGSLYPAWKASRLPILEALHRTH